MLTVTACFRLLGLPTGATEDEVRQAYRELARKHHPDRGGDAERFKAISEAYTFLNTDPAERVPRQPTGEPRPRSHLHKSNTWGGPEHRDAFDAWRQAKADFHKSTATGAETPAPDEAEWRTPPPIAESYTPPPQPWLRRARDKVTRWAASRLRVQQGSDVLLKLEVDLQTVVRGGHHKVAISRQARCPSGVGRECDVDCACKGTGRVKVREKLKLYIPPGAHSGARLRLGGKGDDGLDGAGDGDLYLLIEPPQIPGFRREGPDLHGQIDLTRRQAQGGGEIRVPLPLGHAVLEVPAKTQAGARFRLRGQGLPRWGGGRRGDLYLAVEVIDAS